jgi:acyl-CoA synthetase (AMP-forming)/AMP-acid ligase II
MIPRYFAWDLAVHGERPYVFVVTRPGSATTESELTAFLCARVTRAKVPTTIEFVGALPRNAVGRTDKVSLRRRAHQP